MAEQDVINLLRENIDAFSANDMDRFGATLADGNVYEEFATQRRVEGRDALIGLMGEWKQSFPDADGTITSIFASGNRAVAEVTWRGTNQGDMVGPQGTIPASGKSVEVKASMQITEEGGKIKEAHHYFDLMSLLQQIGAVS